MATENESLFRLTLFRKCFWDFNFFCLPQSCAYISRGLSCITWKKAGPVRGKRQAQYVEKGRRLISCLWPTQAVSAFLTPSNTTVGCFVLRRRPGRPKDDGLCSFLDEPVEGVFVCARLLPDYNVYS